MYTDHLVSVYIGVNTTQFRTLTGAAPVHNVYTRLASTTSTRAYHSLFPTLAKDGRTNQTPYQYIIVYNNKYKIDDHTATHRDDVVRYMNRASIYMNPAFGFVNRRAAPRILTLSPLLVRLSDRTNDAGGKEGDTFCFSTPRIKYLCIRSSSPLSRKVYSLL